MCFWHELDNLLTYLLTHSLTHLHTYPKGVEGTGALKHISCRRQPSFLSTYSSFVTRKLEIWQLGCRDDKQKTSRGWMHLPPQCLQQFAPIFATPGTARGLRQFRTHIRRGYSARLAVDMDIHGYIHVWISDFSHPADISMDIVLSHLLIKLNV